MNEKRYFKNGSLYNVYFYAFPVGILVCKEDLIITATKPTLYDDINNFLKYEEITEAEFLQVFHEVQNEITLSYHRQFAKENEFIRNEELKQQGY